jgi:hypothetical protein
MGKYFYFAPIICACFVNRLAALQFATIVGEPYRSRNLCINKCSPEMTVLSPTDTRDLFRSESPCRCLQSAGEMALTISGPHTHLTSQPGGRVLTQL